MPLFEIKRNEMKINNYKVLLIDGLQHFYAKAHKIFFFDGQRKKNLINLPIPLWQKIALRSHLLTRLLRLGVHHFIYDGSGGFYCIYNKQCARFSSSGNLMGKPFNLIGGRPLRVDLYKGAMVYGEYRSNPERSVIVVMMFDGYTHQKLFEMQNIRHIHSIQVKEDKIYFSTGDYGDEAGIWFWDGKHIKCLLKGGQQCRAVDFIVSEDGIYYGTDTPLEQNHIYKMDFDGNITALQEVSSSVFYMSKQAGRYWLATVIEPSDVNTSKHVELWATDPLNPTKWFLIKKFKKDIWPMKLFQYGQIQFPYVYQSSDNSIWFYLQGVKGSGKSFSFSIS